MTRGKALRMEVEVGRDTMLMKASVATDSKTDSVSCHGISNKGVAEDRYVVDCLVEDLV